MVGLKLTRLCEFSVPVGAVVVPDSISFYPSLLLKIYSPAAPEPEDVVPTPPLLVLDFLFVLAVVLALLVDEVLVVETRSVLCQTISINGA